MSKRNISKSGWAFRPAIFARLRWLLIGSSVVLLGCASDGDISREYSQREGRSELCAELRDADQSLRGRPLQRSTNSTYYRRECTDNPQSFQHFYQSDRIDMMDF